MRNWGGKIICDYIAYLRQWVPPIRIIALVDQTSQLSSTQLLQHELCACLFKSEITDTLPQIIHLVAQGATWFSRAVVEWLLQQETKPCLEQATPTLTKRERQVLELVVKGQSNSQIAAILQVAEQTVRNYISQVYSKLDLRDRTDAIIRFDRLIPQ